MKLWHLVLATLGTLALAFYLARPRRILDRSRAFDFCAFEPRSLLRRRHAVLRRDDLGAMIELGETLSLVLLASL